MLILIITSSYGQQNSIKVQMAPLKRKQIAGSHSLILPSHFEYLKLYNGDQRFAPDEPSSHSSIEYFFKERKLKQNVNFDWSLGLFRNHIKGDIILEERIIHFGRGSSHFGVSSTQTISSSLFSSNYRMGFSNQIGIGPLVTQFKNDDLNITPDTWGVNGYGLTYSVGIELRSPIFFNRLTIHLGTLLNFSFIKFKSIQIIDNSNYTTNYSKLHFVTMNNLPALNIGLSYSFLNTTSD